MAGVFQLGVFQLGVSPAAGMVNGRWQQESDVAADPEIDFNQQIRPILSDKCFFCHGPDSKHREAGLRLDIEEEAKDDAIVPGDSAESELFLRIATEDADELMPPPHSNKRLSADEIELLRKWIDQGAPYDIHWSFRPPRKPRIPTREELSAAANSPAANSSVASELKLNNAIDAFVVQRLVQARLEQSREAAAETLVRRVTFDLTGLPPSPADVREFLADEDPLAYAKLVDRLLASPAFGERMAADWLDVARYSDTYGYQVDRDRFVWPWRDWVIDAFNRNQPYDEFLLEQLAGDMLPEPTREQILATTFCRLHPQKVEGGSVEEEFRAEYVADRTQTVATAFLGLTLECARCHDHKFDPLSQQEYYQLTAFFDNIDESGLYSYFTNSVPTPTLDLPTDQQANKRELLQSELQQVEARLQDVETRLAQQWQKRLDKLASGAGGVEAASASEISWEELQRQGLQLASLQPKLVYDFEDAPVKPDDAPGNRGVEGKIGKALQLTGDDGVGSRVGNFARHQPFSVSLWVWVPDADIERAVIFHRSRAWTDAASRGYELLIEDGRASAALIHFWPGNALRVVTQAPLPVRSWTHVTLTYDGSSRASGLKLFVDGRPARLQVLRDGLTRSIRGGGGDHITIGERFRDRGFKLGRVDEFQVFDQQLTELECLLLAAQPRLTQSQDAAGLMVHSRFGVLAWQFPRLTTELKTRRISTELVARHLIQRGTVQLDMTDALTARRSELLEELAAARARLFELQNQLSQIMVMRELETPRDSFLLNRGQYDQPTQRVIPGLPQALPQFGLSARAAAGNGRTERELNRLDLARWMVHDQHPLTSRVIVNRIWQLLFGRGLVSTPEDFGNQGQPPSHPELLDYLACELVEHDWDLKWLIREIVLSHTYRQSSRIVDERDPENILLARAPSYRLSAEMLRDNALAASGLLVRKIGGPPVRPYELSESFKPVRVDQGEGLYRRSLYTYWKRTGPSPVMLALDAAKRDVCQVRREKTSTPLQALVMQNSPQFIEAGRGLAMKAWSDVAASTAGSKLEGVGWQRDVIAEMFWALASRSPKQSELDVLAELAEQQFQYFSEDSGRADEFLAIGSLPIAEPWSSSTENKARLAALATVANLLMNFDACVIRR